MIKKKKILKDVKVVEISLCPEGINENAKIILQKKKDQQKKALSLFTNLENAVYILEESISEILANSDTDDKISKAASIFTDYRNKLELIVNDTGIKQMDIEELKKSVETSAETIKNLQASLDSANESLEMFKAMSSVQKEYRDSLDDEKKLEFEKMSDEERTAAATKGKKVKKKEKESDEDEGDMYKGLPEKVVVMLKKAQDQAEQAEQIAKSERSKREEMELAKSLQQKYPKVPGTDVQKAKLMKALDGDKDVKIYAEKLLTIINKGLDGLTTELGNSHDESVSGPQEQLKKMSMNYAKEHNISESAAYLKVLDTSEGKQLFKQRVNQERN